MREKNNRLPVCVAISLRIILCVDHRSKASILFLSSFGFAHAFASHCVYAHFFIAQIFEKANLYETILFAPVWMISNLIQFSHITHVRHDTHLWTIQCDACLCVRKYSILFVFCWYRCFGMDEVAAFQTTLYLLWTMHWIRLRVKSSAPYHCFGNPKWVKQRAKCVRGIIDLQLTYVANICLLHSFI